jgi:hypothetical protein
MAIKYLGFGPVLRAPVFVSGLTLKDQRKQLWTLIANFSQRLRAYEEGTEKEVLALRLVRLKEDLSVIQDALALSPEEPIVMHPLSNVQQR